MDAGTYSAVSGSLAAQTRLDVIAHNLANVNTPGYKAEILTQASDNLGQRPFGAVMHEAVTRGELKTDFSQGSLQTSGNPLDVALTGEGFLVVGGPRGERLTRHGSLTIDPDGYLATNTGLRVQGQNGDINLPPGKISIAPDGSIKVDDAQVGTLRLVRVKDPNALQRESGGLFKASGQALEPQNPDEIKVVQGALEQSNYSAVAGMVALVEAMRGFESYVNATQRLDQISSRAIGDVGRIF